MFYYKFYYGGCVMKEENRKYAREAMDIVEHAANKIGSRLPGSDGEIKLHKYMGEKLREIGIEPKTEEFAVSPRSGIGSAHSDFLQFFGL